MWHNFTPYRDCLVTITTTLLHARHVAWYLTYRSSIWWMRHPPTLVVGHFPMCRLVVLRFPDRHRMGGFADCDRGYRPGCAGHVQVASVLVVALWICSLLWSVISAVQPGLVTWSSSLSSTWCLGMAPSRHWRRYFPSRAIHLPTLRLFLPQPLPPPHLGHCLWPASHRVWRVIVVVHRNFFVPSLSASVLSAGSVLWLPPRWLRIVLHLALPWSVSFMIHSRNWWAITSWLVLGGQYSAAVNEAGLLQRLMLNASAAVRRDFHYFSGGFFLHFVSC